MNLTKNLLLPLLLFPLLLAVCGGVSSCSWMDALGDEDGSLSSSSAQGVSSSAAQGVWIIDTLELAGDRYPMAKIGEQVWLAKNLNATPGAGKSWCYGGMAGYCERYGRLYDFEAASSACPAGWRLPTQDDWNLLLDFVNDATGEDMAGKYLKASDLWSNDVGLDRFGFAALPGGFRQERGEFTALQERGYWWSESKDTENAYYRSLTGTSDLLSSGYEGKGRGFSVRCVNSLTASPAS
jgi:uncharacterized protein (TIGR02145 family)